MRLTDHTDYALRVLMYLGAHDGRLATTDEVATLHGISHNHLTKVVNQLGHAGFVKTVRGRAGGIRLARPACDITVGDVVRCTEPDLHVVACLDGRPSGCAYADTCCLKRIFRSATSSFLDVLDRVPLSSLLAPAGAPA
ncbi:RrF2 family transcriptional regulator [Massilia aerilata]|uniref:RrF2 family transcriptional regulator n=1 Tax=Massilia aerilata TaxID=453817 RepID=A0ABW0RX39_9BURK